MHPNHRKSRPGRGPLGRVIALFGVLALGSAALIGVSTSAGATSVDYPNEGYHPTLSGRAYGIGFVGTKVLGAPVPDGFTPDTGYVSTSQSSVVTKQCGNIPAGIVVASLMCPKVVTDAYHGRSTASSAVAKAHVGVPGLPVVDVTAVEATSSSTCFGASGSTTIAYLKVGTKVIIAKPTAIAPNTTLVVGPLTLVLNEQLTDSESGDLTVNAVHLRAHVPNVVTTNIVISSAQSGISNCYFTDIQLS